jgi:colanic acid biosynthesis glycosyl transferase WcaI
LIARGIGSDQIVTIPNWCDVQSVAPRRTEESKTRSSLGLRDRFIVGYSGNFGRAHEFDTLVGAASLLRTDPQFAFLMTGTGAKAGPLQQAVGKADLTSFVFQDFQPAELLGDSLAAADVHLVSLLPALEGLIVPSKMYGILAAGRPAIFVGDPRGDVADLLRERDCGVAVAVGDSQGLANELRRLRDDRGRLEGMGRRARQVAVEHFSGEQAASAWLQFLDSVAPGVRPHALPGPVC